MKFTIGTIVLLVLSTVLALGTADGADRGPAYQAGYVVGGAIAPLLIAGVVLLAARLLGKAKAPGAGAKLVFWTVGVVVALNVIGIGSRGLRALAPVPVTDAERHGLEIGTDSIRHRAFGFVLPHPGPAFHPAPDVQRQVDAQLAAQPSMAAWVLVADDGSGMVMIQVTKGGVVTEQSLRAFGRGVGKGVMKGDVTVLEDTVEWRGTSGEYRFRGQNQAAVYLSIRCLPTAPRKASVIVCVETGSGGRDDDLRFVRAGLAVGH